MHQNKHTVDQMYSNQVSSFEKKEQKTISRCKAKIREYTDKQKEELNQEKRQNIQELNDRMNKN